MRITIQTDHAAIRGGIKNSINIGIAMDKPQMIRISGRTFRLRNIAKILIKHGIDCLDPVWPFGMADWHNMISKTAMAED
jgi:hypothetical protein